MSVENYSEHGGRVKLLNPAAVLRGSSADLPRILRGAGKTNLVPNAQLTSSRLMSSHEHPTHEKSPKAVS